MEFEMAQEVLSKIFILGATGVTGATGGTTFPSSQTLTFLTGEAFKGISFIVSSQGQTVPTTAKFSAAAFEGAATLGAKNATATGIDGILYADLFTRGPNQPASNWARQQAGQFVAGPSMTITLTNNDTTNPIVLMAMIVAETFLFV
jgi:hypothetical protein